MSHGSIAQAARRTQLLYDRSQAERDACGVGFIATTRGGAGAETAKVLPMAIEALRRLNHRGGIGADGTTGDGAGIMTQIPHEFFLRELAQLGCSVPLEKGELGVGMFFVSRETGAYARLQQLVAQLAPEEGLQVLGWRDVPVCPEALGEHAARTRPHIGQLFVRRPAGDDALGFERRLFRFRRKLERALGDAKLDACVVSLSGRTVVYKGLLIASQLAAFFPDLSDPEYRTAFALFHQRYSTNTTPAWRRVQPFRMLAHNGEINTIHGNANWMAAREAALRSDALGDVDLRPVLEAGHSDSGMLDNAVELLTLAGRDVRHVLMMLIPEAWEGIAGMDQARRDFYRYHSCLTEPWDGPAAIVFSDGRWVGARLDRNGLRPLRYILTEDGFVIAGSEVGIASIEPERVVERGRLGPGQMIAVDLEAERVYKDQDIKAEIATRKPYGEWLGRHMVSLARIAAPSGHGAPAAVNAHANGKVPGNHAAAPTGEVADGRGEAQLTQHQLAFGYTSEELIVVLRPMAEDGKEPGGSMGDDTALAVLSYQPRPLFHYFKQRFAEVTNPPIDHLRERLVFSLRTLLGARDNLLAERPEAAALIELPGPVLLGHEMQALEELARRDTRFPLARLDTVFPVAGGPEELARALARVVREAEAAVDDGARLLVLCDRKVDEAHAPIPSLMAVGAVHHHLIRRGKRMLCSIIVESGEPREVHHIAALLGYGASAVYPYLALETVAAMRYKDEALTPQAAQERFRKACEEGLLKVMSKMGISTVDGYTGAQTFEAVGLADEVVQTCFPGTPSVVKGNGFADIARVVLAWHEKAFPQAGKLDSYGFYKPRKGGEHHDFTPETARKLHEAVGLKSPDSSGFGVGPSRAAYDEWVRMVNALPSQLRSALTFRSDRRPIALDEVEPVEAIVKRFSTAQMSLGSLSPEAHEVLAIAMNRLGARSGSGEGGEDPERFGTERNSAVKQVASGRFGVTPAYLASAAEIQIKIAQGSKPGEGGQIPGDKVTPLIARLRKTTPGVALISPPPHHDIYSIEDLAQLIYDLKAANPEAEISVKLVAQTGVGTIAAGVAKGGADVIVISGHSGGTGSSPLNSIKNAGLPWEIGLAETQQALLDNNLRHRVGLRVDGGLKSGRDVVIAALLGADEFSFGTAAMIAEGCVMARVCHNNTCPAGVATQRPDLRAKFVGKPENVMAYMLFVAQEVREILAGLGYRSLQEIIGRTDLLEQVRTGHPAFARLDLSPLLGVPAGCEDRPRRRVLARNDLLRPHPPDGTLRADAALLIYAAPAMALGKDVEVELPIANTDRAVGATLAFAIARCWGDRGLPKGSIHVTFRGSAGQSFGAFLPPGVRFTLIGEANDYVGKGLAGGEIVVRPFDGTRYAPHEHVIMGNTVLYGATGGTLFACGRAGERFAVRNSGCLAVVEGTGDHACEYMTGGTVVILGPTGYNVAAGMTGGELFVLDETGVLPGRINAELVSFGPVDEVDGKRLLAIVQRHYELTGSPKARALLADWRAALRRFVAVRPKGAKPAQSVDLSLQGVEEMSRAG
nr:glutamate synthase large subunit [Bacillota bacterium]